MNKPQFKTLDQKRQDRPTRSNRFNDQNTSDNRNEKPQRQRYSDEKPWGERGRNEKRFDNRSESSHNNRPTRFEPKNVYPREGVGQQGNLVKIRVKEEGESARHTEKKTGALSPRAPEKIRKNRSEEMKVYGENACLALFAERPEAIVRLWATVEMSHRLGAVLSFLAEQKKAYHIVSQEELTLVAGTEHHGGIAMLVKKAVPFSLEGYLQIAKTQDCLVLLDSVNNAQNIGGILRTCAFYGVAGVVVENADQLSSSNAARVAEGGLEFVKALETKNKQIALAQLRQAGYQIVRLTRNKQAPHLAKTTLGAKVVFVLSETVSHQTDESEDTTVQLSFNNPLQSGLNVAVASGVLLGAWYERYFL